MLCRVVSRRCYLGLYEWISEQELAIKENAPIYFFVKTRSRLGWWFSGSNHEAFISGPRTCPLQLRPSPSTKLTKALFELCCVPSKLQGHFITREPVFPPAIPGSQGISPWSNKPGATRVKTRAAYSTSGISAPFERFRSSPIKIDSLAECESKNDKIKSQLMRSLNILFRFRFYTIELFSGMFSLTTSQSTMHYAYGINLV